MADLHATLTIADSGTESNIVAITGDNSPVMGFLIMAPATLAETVNIMVAEKSGGTFRKLRSNSVVFAFAAGCADQFTLYSGSVMKLVATGAVSGAKAFHLIGHPLR